MRTPSVFISYCWTSPELRSWVRDLAERLSFDGVHVHLDIWDLHEGHDKYAFMERMITDPELDRVLIVSDAVYAEKADQRRGGVGDETQIITSDIYRTTEQTKFIPLVMAHREDGSATLPAYLRSRMYLDFSVAERFDESYERLLRSIWNAREIERPALGVPPSFVLGAEGSEPLRTYSQRDEAVDDMLCDIAEARTGVAIYCRVYYSELVRRVEFERALAEAALRSAARRSPFRVRQITTDPTNMDSVRQLYDIEDPARTRWRDLEDYRRHLNANAVDRYAALMRRVRRRLGARADGLVQFEQAFYAEYLAPYSFVLVDDGVLYASFHTRATELRFGRDMPTVRVTPVGQPGSVWFERFSEEIEFIETADIVRATVLRAEPVGEPG